MYGESKYFVIEVYFKVNSNEIIIISNFWSLISAFDKEFFITISIIDTALAQLKYTVQLVFNKA